MTKKEPLLPKQAERLLLFCVYSVILPTQELARLDHHAGGGPGDPLHGLDLGDHQFAQRIRVGDINEGDHIVGTCDVVGTYDPLDS